MKKRMYFNDDMGNRLCGILSEPNIRENEGVVVMCHGFASSKESEKFVRFEKTFNDSRINTFRFDFFGHGASEGELKDITISKAVYGIENAIKLLRGEGYKNFGLIGSSFGGLAGAIASSKIKDIFALALISPISDFYSLTVSRLGNKSIAEWKKSGYAKLWKIYRIEYGFLRDAKKNNSYKVAKNIKAKTLIVHGDKDEIVPIEQSQKLAGMIPDCRLEIIHDADHVYSKKLDFEHMLSLVSDFIIKSFSEIV
jgi:hypothetical protein